jgi:hypothetical protein
VCVCVCVCVCYVTCETVVLERFLFVSALYFIILDCCYIGVVCRVWSISLLSVTFDVSVWAKSSTINASRRHRQMRASRFGRTLLRAPLRQKCHW